MVINGGSRAGPDQLAAHLLRTDTNERVTILELNSPVDGLRETFRDWQVLSTGTRGTKGLYHANIDPATQYDMTREQWLRSVDVLEEKLGFTGQPRAVVMHEKNGREHIHVVWQRTDVERMRLVSDSYNYIAHEEASYQLEKEFGHEHVPGKHAKRDRELQAEFPRAEFTHAEWQQMERSGEDRRARREHLRDVYEASDSAQAFKAALEEEGYLLARGDRRDFVLVDTHGHILSISRELPGVPTKERRAFLAQLDPASLPGVDDAKRLQAERAPRRDQAEGEAERDKAESPEKHREGESDRKPEEPSPPKPEAPAPDKTPDKAPEESDAQRRFREALERREADETAALRQKHLEEFTQMERSLDQEIAKEMAAFQKGQQQERDRLERHGSPRDRADLLARQNAEQREQRTLLRQDKNQELDALHARQATEMAALKRDHAAERGRYRKEQEAAARLARELEERRRLEEERKRSRDGPERGPTR